MNKSVSPKGLLTMTLTQPRELAETAYLSELQELRNWCKQNIGQHVHIVTRQNDDAKIPEGHTMFGTIRYVEVGARGNDVLVLDDVIICNSGIGARKRPQCKLDLRCVETLMFNPNWCKPGIQPNREQTSCGC